MEKQEIGNAILYLGDCAEILPTLGQFDAVVTDPPYGIGMDGGNVGYKGFNNFEKLNWDKCPPSDELINLCISKGNEIIFWGGNYFNLPPSRCWLIWDKGNGFKNRTYAEAELAWTSMDANVRVFSYDPLANGDYKGKSHPTQKPIKLMEWCISKTKANTILDPFMGSGSTGVACMNLEKQFVGIERERKYFDIACKRLEDAQRQERLF